MEKIVSCALILAALSSVASMCFAMNDSEIVTPEISPAGTPVLTQEEQPSMLTRHGAMADLFGGSVAPEIPQGDETPMLPNQNAMQGLHAYNSDLVNDFMVLYPVALENRDYPRARQLLTDVNANDNLENFFWWNQVNNGMNDYNRSVRAVDSLQPGAPVGRANVGYDVRGAWVIANTLDKAYDGADYEFTGYGFTTYEMNLFNQ